MTRNYIGGFGGGFIDGLGAGAGLAQQYQAAELQSANEEQGRLKAMGAQRLYDQDAQDAAQVQSTPAAQPLNAAPTPAPAMAYGDAWKEAMDQEGPPDTRPISAETSVAMPPQVANPAPGKGIGVGFSSAPAQPPAAAAPAPTQDFGSSFNEAVKSDALPARRVPVPPQVDNPGPGRGVGAGMETLLHPERFTVAAKAPVAPVDDAPRMVKTALQSAPAADVTATPVPKPPAPVAAPVSGDQPAAKKRYTYADFLNHRIQSAARLGLSDEVNASMAELLSHQYANAALEAYQTGDYNRVYRLHNMLPDGYTVKREVLQQNPDGTGGVKLTMVNDKTGQVYGQPRTFTSDREAAGAMVAAADPKGLANWLIQSGKEDLGFQKLAYTQLKGERDAALRVADMSRKGQDSEAARQARMEIEQLRAAVRGGGSGSGSRSGRSGAAGDASPFKQDDFFKNYVGTQDGAAPAWGPSAYAYANQIVENNPLLSQTEGGRARAAVMARNVARAESGEDIPVTGMANYRPLPSLNANGTWDATARDENGNTYYLERDINPAGLIRKGKDGKAIGGIDDAWVKQQEVGFMQNYAKANPDRFKQLTAAASNPEGIKRMAALAQADPSKQADLRIMQMVQKYGANPTAPAPAGSAPATPAAPRQIFTPAELQDAKELGVEPGVPLAKRLGNAWEGVKSAVSGLGEVSPASFANYVAQARRTGRIDADAQLLMAAMRRNPELAKQLTPKELNAVQVAANKRL